VNTPLFRRDVATARRLRDIRDRSLLARIASRDRRALEGMYLEYRPRLQRFFACLTPRSDRVEEMVIDTWVEVWQTAREYRGDWRVNAWISNIALRHGLLLPIDLSRARRKIHEAADDLGRALHALPIEQRALFGLTYCLECSCEEIAFGMNCAVSTVNTRMTYIRRHLHGVRTNSRPEIAGPFKETNDRSPQQLC
jgi:RNA polymerase sigma-70 factor (ECF subfamily)